MAHLGNGRHVGLAIEDALDVADDDHDDAEPACELLSRISKESPDQGRPRGQQDPVCTEVTSVWRLILEPIFHLNTLTARYFWPWQKGASRHGVPAES